MSVQEKQHSTSDRTDRLGAAVYLLVIVYLMIHLKFEIDFWFNADSNPFAKFVNSSGETMMETAKKAYLAKSTWLFLTILLLTFRISFPLALGIGSLIYGVELLLFFGPIWMAWGSLTLGVLVILEWLYRWRGRNARRGGLTS